MSPEGMINPKAAKSLVVKVDDKTREFLEEFEQTLGRSDVSDYLARDIKLIFSG